MPFVANTPESLLGRSDSKNAATTCIGITAVGRPCRRPIAAAAADGNSLAPPSPRHRAAPLDYHDEALYCWQHKEQASRSARSSPGPRANNTPILEQGGRASLDTLADRLGLALDLNVPDDDDPAAAAAARRAARKREELRRQRTGDRKKPKHKQQHQQQSQLSFCFCFSIPISKVDDADPAPRPRPQPRPVQQQQPEKPTSTLPASHRRESSSANRLSVAAPPLSSPGRNSHRSQASATSLTASYLSLIPASASPATASALLTELARPYVASEEPGYIYMFWMTPASDPTPPPIDAARSLLPSGPAPRPRASSRRPSDVVSTFAAQRTMLLKIGRAANVQRRMNQWGRQCGYAVEMLRWYPYLSAAAEARGAAPRQTPHVKKVEKLIHLELAGLGLRAGLGVCAACGHEHREWFEVEASREGIRAVDEAVRRWVEWDDVIVLDD